MKILKCIIAIAASAFGSLYVLGIGLVGTGHTPLSQPILLVLGVSLIAGVIIALLPKTLLMPVFTAAATPAGFLAFLMIQGCLEKKHFAALLWLAIPLGIVALIMLPSLLRNYWRREKMKSEPAA